MTDDIRDYHEEMLEQDIDFEDLKYYAFGEQVRDSLIGREVEDYSFVVVEADKEEMKDRGFNMMNDYIFEDSMGNPFYLAGENNSLEHFLRHEVLFTMDAIAMKPGEQSYHYPLMNAYPEDEERAEQPINPVKDLDDRIIRHTDIRHSRKKITPRSR
jgi:hypothetical protein